MKLEYSHRPYLPYGWKKQEIYVVRLAPNKNGVKAQWLGEEKSYTVEVRKGDVLVKAVYATENYAEVNGLDENENYTLTVVSGEKKSRVRLFTTGDYRGDVINYLHTDDLQYEYSGRYLASPFIVEFQGDLYVSMDCFRGGDQRGGFNLTILFRSKDDGKTWDYVCDLIPGFWGTLFVANGRLCLLSCSTEFGSLIVSSSADGENWSAPTTLIYGNGSGYGVGVHKGVGAPCECNGKLFFPIEYGGYPVNEFAPFIVAYDLSKDVQDIGAWERSEVCRVEHEWGGAQDIRFAIEGNLVLKDGEMYNLLRFAGGQALVLKVDTDNVANAPTFHKVVNLPIGHCKFFVQQAEDGTYYAMGNHTCYPRHIIRLYSSKDLENWELVETVEDISALDKDKDGIQYPGFIIKGNKLYTVLRIGLHGSHSFHDSNAIALRVVEIKK